MGKYKNENWVKKGKKWVNIRIKIRLNFGFFMVKKCENTRIF